MPHSASDGDRLLQLTLMVEVAVKSDDWSQVTELLHAREAVIESMSGASDKIVRELGIVEERILTDLKNRLGTVRADLRNLTAALRIAGPYARAERPSSISLAG